MQSGTVGISKENAIRLLNLDTWRGVKLRQNVHLQLCRRRRRLDRLLSRRRRLAVGVASLDGTEARGQMGHQTSPHRSVQTGKLANFAGALRVTGAEFVEDGRIRGGSHSDLLSLKGLQMLHGQFQNVSLLELRVSCWL